MIVEERTYVLDTRVSVAEYLSAYRDLGFDVQVSYLGAPVGAFITDVGELHALVTLWKYESHQDRADRRAKLAADPTWQACLEVIRPMINRLTNRIMIPTDYSPLR